MPNPARHADRAARRWTYAAATAMAAATIASLTTGTNLVVTLTYAAVIYTAGQCNWYKGWSAGWAAGLTPDRRR